MLQTESVNYAIISMYVYKYVHCVHMYISHIYYIFIQLYLHIYLHIHLYVFLNKLLQVLCLRNGFSEC